MEKHKRLLDDINEEKKIKNQLKKIEDENSLISKPFIQFLLLLNNFFLILLEKKPVILSKEAPPPPVPAPKASQNRSNQNLLDRSGNSAIIKPKREENYLVPYEVDRLKRERAGIQEELIRNLEQLKVFSISIFYLKWGLGFGSG